MLLLFALHLLMFCLKSTRFFVAIQKKQPKIAVQEKTDLREAVRSRAMHPGRF